MNKIAFAGTFDPLTNGHLWVIEEGLKIANKVVVFVAQNINKKTMFSAEKRKEMIQKTLNEKKLQDKVDVVIVRNEYVAKRALEEGAEYLIRGIRSAGDFDYEQLIQKTNTDILKGAKTIFVMPPPSLDSVSSSFVKSFIGPVGWHWNIKNFLPYSVYEEWLNHYVLQFFETEVVKMSTEMVQSQVQKDKVNEFRNLLLTQYQGAKRNYHNLEHIAHCIQEFLWARENHYSDDVNYRQLALAILAHDIIYKDDELIKQKINLSGSDERKSAQVIEHFFGKDFYYACQIIEATQHTSNLSFELDETMKLMRSIDLAILGQEEHIYEQYIQDIRAEYMEYNEYDYRMGRKKVLEKFAQAQLFEHPAFYHYEQFAKDNIQKELNKM